MKKQKYNKTQFIIFVAISFIIFSMYNIYVPKKKYDLIQKPINILSVEKMVDIIGGCGGGECWGRECNYYCYSPGGQATWEETQAYWTCASGCYGTPIRRCKIFYHCGLLCYDEGGCLIYYDMAYPCFL